MKDKHNVILILVSSSESNFLFRRFIKILDLICSSFFSGVPSVSALSLREAPSKSSQGFTLCFQFLFPFVWSSFCYRSSSWRLYMVVRQEFFSFFNCSSRFISELLIRHAIYSKLNVVQNTCLVLRISSILHLAFRSAILSFLFFEVVLCHCW